MVVAFLFLFVSPAHATAPVMPPEATTVAQGESISIESLITRSAQKWSVDRRVVARVIECESGGNPNAVGDNGTSFGIVQIHAPSHPQISRAQALDPAWAINFLAHQISLGNGSMWTCFKIIRGAVP